MSPSTAVLAPEDTPPGPMHRFLWSGDTGPGEGASQQQESRQRAEVDSRGSLELNETRVQRNDLFWGSVPTADFSATLLGCAHVAPAPQCLSTLPCSGGA